MSDSIVITGIETNNLKCIDIEIKKRAINLIIGPSGSGKSSLAYDTIAQIGQHEFMSMFADNISEPSYKVRDYQNMIVSVPIRQSNFNNNMRSTIGTYFGINHKIALVYAALLGLSEDIFTLNKQGNLCEHCNGLGVTSVLDKNRVINYDIPLKNNPIKCWNKHKDFYKQIIYQFCLDYKIDLNKTFRQLSEDEKNLFLFGESEKKYTIKYKKTNSFSRRTTRFYGIMTGIPMMPNFKPAKQFFSDKECEYCHGKKYSEDCEQYELFGLSIGEFMTLPFKDLYIHVNQILKQVLEPRVVFALNYINDFLKMSIEHNLGHLFFNRAIPTLSGGELQRLRMVQVFNTQLSDLLIILDEPLAGLSGNEKITVYNNILKLSERHTIVVVDHSDIFVKDAKNIIALGEKGGKDGGKLINPTNYIEQQKIKKEFIVAKQKNDVSVIINNSVYQYIGVKINIGIECMNLITGSSGIGKSTLLREYLPQYFEKYVYINQKPLLGNKNSSVATVLNIFGYISNAFAKKFNKDKRFFSNLTGNEGACPICCGAGYLEYGSERDTKIRLECKECEGTGFNKNLKKYKINNKNIFDVWRMTLDEASIYFQNIDKKIVKPLEHASSIMLGHLKVGQSTASLSGGENIRIKILKSIKSTSKVLGIDEPFKGLNNSEIYCVASFLDQLRKSGKTIIVVDHTEVAFRYFARHIKLIEKNKVLLDENDL